MYKVYVLLLIVLLILIIGNIFITREGFYNDEPTISSSSSQTETEIECSFETKQVENDCNKITTENNDEFLVHNVCPLNPKCLGICVNDFTWTEENKKALGIFDKSSYRVGDLKIQNEQHNSKLKALFKSSRCMECIKNFYSGIKLINSNVGCEYQG